MYKTDMHRIGVFTLCLPRHSSSQQTSTKCLHCPSQGWVWAPEVNPPTSQPSVGSSEPLMEPRGLGWGLLLGPLGPLPIVTFGLFCLCLWVQPPDFRDLPEWEPRIREASRTGDLDSKPDPSRSFRPYRAEDNDSYASEVGLGLSRQVGG